MKIKLPHSSQNWLSLTGAMIALITFFMIVFLSVVAIFLEPKEIYLGLVTFILLPAVMIAGLVLIPIGMYLKSREEKKRGLAEIPVWPSIDLNDPRHRHGFFIFTIGTTIFLFMSAIGSYEAFHYTESVAFCGKLCHRVMNPQYTAYRHSPHARVLCVSCHVGPGASWYVRSKLSGLYQVYATLADIYPRPIPTPIKNLRPARQTCEQCHWPEKFYTYSLEFKKLYLADKDNTEWNLRLIMKIGPQHQAQRLKQGIHWHINPEVTIEYIATDEKREVIPWVRYTNKQTGAVTVYQDQNNPLTKQQINTLEIRTMDCIDCHNEPSHRYRSPSNFINIAMSGGEIPTDLPDMKSIALQVCARKYTSKESALQEIEKQVNQYYQKNYPQIYSKRKKDIEKAVSGIQDQFSMNIFPYMKVRWSAYTDNIGHLIYNGCFRCHNNTHKSDKGVTIRRDCNLCHLINAQGKPGNMQVAPSVNESLEFKHPVDIGGAWKEVNCDECHSGLNP
ncbi:MAG: NapC/NirT family cytochrome c [Deltaproteobacteria bacterium]|jgi:nitrate/TMAO reductase-like tetraheme cytochrome c subunit